MLALEDNRIKKMSVEAAARSLNEILRKNYVGIYSVGIGDDDIYVYYYVPTTYDFEIKDSSLKLIFKSAAKMLSAKLDEDKIISALGFFYETVKRNGKLYKLSSAEEVVSMIFKEEFSSYEENLRRSYKAYQGFKINFISTKMPMVS